MKSENPQELFGLYLAHVGINAKGDTDALEIANKFLMLMGLPIVEKAPISYFSGTVVEIMKEGGRGTHGHLGFHVDDIAAAEAWFTRRGFAIDEASRKLAEDGSTFLVYFKDEIAGFAIHLTQGK